MLGILVNGSNHFIVSGPRPDSATARALVRQWSLIQIGKLMAIPGWTIRTNAFREDLLWAIEVRDGQPRSTAVTQLLEELSARGIVTETLE